MAPPRSDRWYRPARMPPTACLRRSDVADRIKYAAVGCGGMGRRHLNGMAALYKSSQPNMELVAVCDLNQENANWLADEAEKLLGPRPRAFADIAEMARPMPGLP